LRVVFITMKRVIMTEYLHGMYRFWEAEKKN
jgi:hypothetical protein